MARNVFRRLHLSRGSPPRRLSPRQRMDDFETTLHCVELEVKRLETEREREKGRVARGLYAALSTRLS